MLLHRFRRSSDHPGYLAPLRRLLRIVKVIVGEKASHRPPRIGRLGARPSLRVVLIIPMYDKVALTCVCLWSILRNRELNPPVSFVIVDDHSGWSSRGILAAISAKLKGGAFPMTIIRNERNLGYVASVNRGIDYALAKMDPTHVMLMNNDVVLSGPWLSNMLEFDHEYAILGYQGRDYVPGKVKSCYYLEFSGVLLKKEVFMIGRLDPKLTGGYYTDDDFLLRALKQGFRVGQLRNTIPTYFLHIPGGTAGPARAANLRIAYRQLREKWGSDESTITKEYLENWLWNPDTKGWGMRQAVEAKT